MTGVDAAWVKGMEGNVNSLKDYVSFEMSVNGQKQIILTLQRGDAMNGVSLRMYPSLTGWMTEAEWVENGGLHFGRSMTS